MFIRSANTLPAKLFRPSMVHVTEVLVPSPRKVKEAWFVALIGLMNSMVNAIFSGEDSVIVIFPSFVFWLSEVHA